MKQETQAVVVAPEQAIATAGAPSPLAILQAAVQQGATVDVIERLAALAERMEANEARKEFYAAKSRLHAKLPQIEQNGTIVVPARDGKAGHKSKYVKYEDLDLIVRPIMEEEGFSFDFDSPEATVDMAVVNCTLRHRLGHHETKSLRLPLDKSGSKNLTQAMVSTVKGYGRRVLVEMWLNIVKKGEDIDGHNPEKFESVTQEQADEIMGSLKTLEELGCTVNREKFLEVYGAAAIAEIPRGNFARARDYLRQKIAEVSKK